MDANTELEFCNLYAELYQEGRAQIPDGWEEDIENDLTKTDRFANWVQEKLDEEFEGYMEVDHDSSTIWITSIEGLTSNYEDLYEGDDYED